MDYYYKPDYMPEVTVIYNIISDEIEIQEVYINDSPISFELNELILGEWGDVFEAEILQRRNYEF